ncbi:hypothetical protein [Methylobacterium fujisawaense]|uniref:hypothetical protein n=1 Tax=Methylobacterium fujisawaense TaxID=107400 RepID=UPI002F3520FC
MPKVHPFPPIHPGFRSHKTPAVIHYPQRWHRDVLLQLSLDPSVVSVRRGPVSDIPNALTLDLQTQAGIVRLIALRDECQMTAQAEQAGLVPVHRSTFLREPRVGTARAVWAMRKHIVPPADRLRILDRLHADGRGLPIADLMVCVRSGDAAEAVLAMACDGSVVLDIDGHLTPETIVRLPHQSNGRKDGGLADTERRSGLKAVPSRRVVSSTSGRPWTRPRLSERHDDESSTTLASSDEEGK